MGNVLPVLWLVIVSIGFLATLSNLRASLQDYRYAQRRWPGHHRREIRAWASVRNQASITVIMTLFITIGALALIWPQPRDAPQQIILSVGLLSAVGLLVSMSVLERRDRWRVLE